ncbi:hypothetical protein ACJVC5_08305 [Peredibacter sp. HCB2-198]|uniref:hypothetical protein n=1 Tax=Peredibacter sp. HCB2-198 TaxID=3383025 RepID=UPI0038B68C89
MKIQTRYLVTATLLFTQLTYAGEAYRRTCAMNLLNALHKLESKSNEPLDMIEFKHGQDVAKIMGDQKLKLGPVPLSREITGVYRRSAVARTAQKTFSDVSFIGHIDNQDFAKLLKPNTYYTYVLDDEKIRFAQTRPGKMRDYGSKHAILRDQNKDLRLAGEFWVDEKGQFHFDGASGTFQPTNDQVKKGIAFFQDQMGIKDAQVHYFNPPAPKPAESHIPEISKPALTASAVVNGAKLVASDKNSLQEVEKLQNDLLAIKDKNGKEIKFKLIKQNQVINEDLYYDSTDLALTQKKAELKVSSSYPDQARKPASTLKDSDESVRMALNYTNGKKVAPVLSQKDESTQYLLIPVSGDSPAYRLSTSEITVKGLGVKASAGQNKKFETTIEEVTPGKEENLVQLSQELQKRFKLKPKTKETNALDLIGAK